MRSLAQDKTSWFLMIFCTKIKHDNHLQFTIKKGLPKMPIFKVECDLIKWLSYWKASLHSQTFLHLQSLLTKYYVQSLIASIQHQNGSCPNHCIEILKFQTSWSMPTDNAAPTPAATRGSWTSPCPWSGTPRSCSWMSPPPGWTLPAGESFGTSSRRSKSTASLLSWPLTGWLVV